MTAFSSSTDSASQICNNDICWQKLYPLFLPRVRRWVYSAEVPAWKDDEEAVLEDIVQEALFKIFKYSQRAERGEVDPIDSYAGFSIVTARNCFKDKLRYERRFIRLSTYDQSYGENVVLSDVIDPLEIALENVFHESLFHWLALEVVRLPKKQKHAFLVDLANHMDSDSPTPLQQAFLAIGIRLQDYCLPLPDNSVERSRHSSLLSIARKRVAKSAYVKVHLAVA